MFLSKVVGSVSPGVSYTHKADAWSATMLAVWLHDGVAPLQSLGLNGARSALAKWQKVTHHIFRDMR